MIAINERILFEIYIKNHIKTLPSFDETVLHYREKRDAVFNTRIHSMLNDIEFLIKTIIYIAYITIIDLNITDYDKLTPYEDSLYDFTLNQLQLKFNI